MSREITLPIRYLDLRQQVRGGVLQSDADRRKWWPIIVRITNKDDITKLPDIAELARRRYMWSIQASLPEGETKEDIVVNMSWNEDTSGALAEKVLRQLIQQYHMQEPGLIYPFLNILTRVVSNTANAYSMMCDFLDRPGWYITPDPLNHRIKLHIFRELTKRYMIRTYTILEQIGALKDEYLNLIFIDFFTPILPISAIYHIIDNYLYDGVKTLYRFGLGLFKMYKRQIKAKQFANGEQFWSFLKNLRNNANFPIMQLNALAFCTEDPIYKRNNVPSRTVLAAIAQQGKDELGDAGRASLKLSCSGIIIDTSLSAESLHTMSQILNEDTASKLRGFLKEPIAHEGFQLMFATWNDGWNLQSLYQQVQGLTPVLIIFRTLDTQAILGIYMPTPISPPTTAVRGDGRCFVFRLDGELSAAYRWTPPESGDVTDSTYSQFAICCNDYMAFGGSKVHGTNAIRIAGDLATGTSGHSDTYRNPPLAPDEPNITFQIADIEVFCGKASVAKSGKQVSGKFLKKDG